MTAEHRSAFLGQIRQIALGKTSELHHAELRQTRIKKDEEAVSAVVQLIQGWINPFTENQDLVSISTAKIAPRDITSDLMKAHSTGEKCYSTFRSERLEKDVPTVKFGIFLLTLWTNWKHLHVSSMLPKLQQPKSMISGTICSVLRRVRLRVTNFHRARTAWLIISSEPTTKLAYGEDVWSRILCWKRLEDREGWS